MKVPQVTLYAKHAGLEIGLFERRSEGKAREGRISLRFFTMEGTPTQIRFVVEPREAHALSLRIAAVSTEKGKESITHKFGAGDAEVVTKLSVEHYERQEKQGYAISIQRGGESINVPVTASDFLYVGEFLRHLSLLQAWVEVAD